MARYHSIPLSLIWQTTQKQGEKTCSVINTRLPSVVLSVFLLFSLSAQHLTLSVIYQSFSLTFLKFSTPPHRLLFGLLSPGLRLLNIFIRWFSLPSPVHQETSHTTAVSTNFSTLLPLTIPITLSRLRPSCRFALIKSQWESPRSPTRSASLRCLRSIAGSIDDNAPGLCPCESWSWACAVLAQLVCLSYIIAR